MKRLVHHFVRVIGIASFAVMTVLSGAADEAAVATMKVVVREAAQPGKVDPRLFGQFLERTDMGTNGAESAFDAASNGYVPAVVEALKKMQIPVIRFPGGTSVDAIDWVNMIDHVPGRTGPRPDTVNEGKTTTNHFGYDEYFALRDQLHCQTILVLNLLDGTSKKVPLEDAANHSVGLLAYANAAVGAKLPAGMEDWPAVRAANGHPAPFKADYVQLGNEWWMNHFHGVVVAKTGMTDPKVIADWYVKCLKIYIGKIREIDPKIPIILDGMMGDDIDQIVLADPFIKKNVRYITFHSYAPGPTDKLVSNGKAYPADGLTPEDWWHSWSAIPGEINAGGENVALGDRSDFAKKLGYHIVCTEWNWNGFGMERLPKPPGLSHALASTLGAASYLNGLIRQGVEIGTMSNLIGKWHIASVQVDPTGQAEPRYSPMARAVNLYNFHHGDRLLDVQVTGDTTYPLTFGTWWQKEPKAAVVYVDVVATASTDTVYLHVINRHRDQAVPLQLDLSALGIAKGTGTQYVITGSLDPAADKALPNFMLEETTKPVEISGSTLDLTLPARSVNVIALPFVAGKKP